MIHMGASDFQNKISTKGLTMQQAFDKLVERAQYNNGHGGYTGTIAEKDCFSAFRVPSEVKTRDDFNAWMNQEKFYLDKWGPANATIFDSYYYFWGMASS